MEDRRNYPNAYEALESWIRENSLLAVPNLYSFDIVRNSGLWCVRVIRQYYPKSGYEEAVDRTQELGAEDFVLDLLHYVDTVTGRKIADEKPYVHVPGEHATQLEKARTIMSKFRLTLRQNTEPTSGSRQSTNG